MVQTNDAATWVAGKSDATAVVVTPSTTGSRYEEIEEISRGGCGVVIRAYDKRLRCEVALKRILPELASDAGVKSRFFHEARITARLAHPGIAPIHDMGDDPNMGSPFYTMKWLQGQTLADVIKAYHALPAGRHKQRNFRELLVRFRYVLQTLSYAHQQGIVHRDLKPSNILVAQFGETIVLDWGLAKEMNRLVDAGDAIDQPASIPPAKPYDTAPASHDLTSIGAILGTAGYMSPEQASGQSHLVDRRADVFSLGVILYEILAGRAPFRCPTQQETLQHILRAEYRPLTQCRPRIPRALVAICDRALMLDPGARYADAGEMEKDLQAWLAGDHVSAYREPWYGCLDRLASKYRSIFWSLLVSLLLISFVSVTSTIAVSQAHRSEKRAREIAETAHAEAQRSLDRETVAHQAAITQLQQARASIDGWLLGLDSVLALYPGLSPLRHQLFNQAIEYYTVLAEQTTPSDIMRLEVLRAKIRLADLQQLNGHATEALHNYQQAIEQLQDHPFGESDWQTIADLQHAAALLGIVQIQLQCDPSAQVDRISEDTHRQPSKTCRDQYLDRAAELCDSITESSPQFKEACSLKAKGMQLRSAALRTVRQFDAAELAIKQAVTLYEARVLPIDPLHSTTQQRQSFLTMLDDLATTHIAAHDYASANDALQRMIHFYDRLLDLDAKRPDWLEARALARLRSGWCHTQLVQPNEAVAQLEASENDLQNAWQLFKGEHTYRDKLAQIHNALGHSYFVGGDLEQAHQLLTRSLTHQAIQPDPQREAETLSRWVQTRLYMATIQIRRGVDSSHLLQEVDSAIAALLRQPELNETVVQSHAQYHWLKAQTQLLMNLNDDAESTLGQAIAWQLGGPASHPTANWHFWLGRLNALRARVAARNQNHELSELSLAAAYQHWQAAYNANDKRWSAHAGFELFEAWLHNSEADSQRTLTALDMARDLVEDHETLPTAWFWLAEWALHADDLETAKAAHEKLARLRRRETMEDRLLKALIYSDDQELRSELSKTACIPGTHADWLQQRLRAAP